MEVPPGATPRTSPAAAQSTHAPVDAHSLSAAAGGVPPSGGRWLGLDRPQSAWDAPGHGCRLAAGSEILGVACEGHAVGA